MATYVYRCEDCGHDTEQTHDMGLQPTWVPCEECGEKAHRAYLPTHHRHVDARGEPMRAPGSEWQGGERFCRKEFEARNPGACKGGR